MDELERPEHPLRQDRHLFIESLHALAEPGALSFVPDVIVIIQLLLDARPVCLHLTLEPFQELQG